jgi:cytoskeleton protein RodZ
MKQEHIILKNEEEQLSGISDDIEVVGPGRMLKEARQDKGLSQQQVADKLNFRLSLVQNIEVEQFDLSLPSAFNRGYLKSYAKLVNISQEDILNSYDQLGVAQRQCAEMQSFSKGTEKQAEHNMLMWISYLILAILVTATVVWWLQSPSEQPEPVVAEPAELTAPVNVSPANTSQSASELNDELSTEPQEALANTLSNTIDTLAAPASTQPTTADESRLTSEIKPNELTSLNVENTSNNDEATTPSELAPDNEMTVDDELTVPLANVVFTFSGDCWVNIYDATGERIAWGVKKSGYVMRISGQAPFSVTLGKPELVQIDYNDISVDMTTFNAGNIAKFSLPLEP